MKDTYYTPDLIEFHYGFEFEANYTKEGWQKEGFGIGEKSVSSIPQLQVQFLKGLPFEGNIRVRHLSKEDILKCGFEFIKVNEFGGDNFTKVQSAGLGGINDTIYNLALQQQKVYIQRISNGTFGESRMNIFEGTILNKSEFFRLLKQLNIPQTK